MVRIAAAIDRANPPAPARRERRRNFAADNKHSSSCKILDLRNCCSTKSARHSPALEDRTRMSRRLDPLWIVMESIENAQYDRCVDVFMRQDGRFGFEEFRRDTEDAGAWTPVSYFSGQRYASKGEALAEVTRRVAWLALRSS